MIAALLLSALVITGNPFTPQPAHPGDAPRVRAGFEALRKGDADAAIADAEAEIRIRPSAAAQELLGAALIQKRQWEGAEAALKRAKALDPKRLGPHLLLGQLQLYANRLDEAEQSFKTALTLSPRDSVAHRGLAGVFLRRGDVGRAVATLEDALKLPAGQDDDLKILLATLYYELGLLPSVERVVGQPCAGAPGCLLLGLTRLDQGRRNDALALLDRAAKGGPNSAWAAVAGGVAARLRGQPRDGVSQLQAAAKRQPDWPFIYREEGEAWLDSGDVPQAVAAFGEAIRTAVDPAMARARVGRALLAHGQREHAARLVDLPPTEKPGSSDSALAVAAVYRRLGQSAKAESLLRASAVRFAKEPRIPYELGLILIESKRDRDAVPPLTTAARLAPKWPEPLMRLAEIQARQGDRRQALATAGQVTKLIGEGPAAQLFIGGVHEQLGDSPGAAAAYRQALEQDPKFVPAALKLAALAEQQGKPDEARAVLEAAAARTTSPLPSLQLALLHDRRGREADAIAAYRATLARDPRNAVALNNLAWLLGKDPQQRDAAIALAERAYKETPESAVVADTLGWLLAESGQLDRGAALLREAVARDPANPGARYHLGAVLARRGEQAAAIDQLRRALGSGQFPEADAARRMLQSLEQSPQGVSATPQPK